MSNSLILFCFLNLNLALAFRKESVQAPANEDKTSGNTEGNRDGKLFSLFSIVQFKNEACTSSQTLANTLDSRSRNGTCFSSTECRDKGGQAAGGCAAGFGTCCVFVYDTTGSTISQNCSYIRNPNYPNAYTDTGALQFQIVKCSQDVCYLRLDFESFDINGLTDSLEYTNANGPVTSCTDKFTITSTADPGLPTICGQNTGQHVYVDMGTGASDTVNLALDFSDATNLANQRFFEIKVTQLPCSSEYHRYPGCFQYHEGLTGRVETFNYQNCLNGQTHLPDQDYSICVRPEAGYDCVQWQLCPDQPCGATTAIGNGVTLGAAGTQGVLPCVAFSVGVNANEEQGIPGDLCMGDLIRINGGSTPCCQGGAGPAPLQETLCGYFFNTQGIGAANAAYHLPICDCIAPYSIDIEFDSISDELTTADNDFTSCGICLVYNQVKC